MLAFHEPYTMEESQEISNVLAQLYVIYLVEGNGENGEMKTMLKKWMELPLRDKVYLQIKKKVHERIEEDGKVR